MGPATLNEVTLLLTAFLYGNAIINTIKDSTIMKLFFIWFVYSMLLLLIGVTKFGLIALRDATHQVDLLTLFIITSLANRFLTKWVIVRIILISLILELCDRVVLANIFNGFTPFSGQPFFGGSIGSNLIVIAGFWIGVLVKDIAKFYRVILILISCSLILIMQNRYMYISLISTTLLYLLYYNYGIKAKLSFVLVALVILLSIEPIVTLITFAGADLGSVTKYGKGLSASGILEHLKTAFGHSSEIYKGADDGFVIRFLWWRDILDLALNNFDVMISGQGFGVPLTSGTHLKPVREPHNSMISIFARGGIFYLLLWLTALGSRIKFILKNSKSPLDIALTFGLISTLIMSLVEPAFELPPVCIIFYFFLGYLLRKKDVYTITN
ncbi:hypothetical protein N9M15_05860 [Bacteroidia bacterium]|nr:hypothetical protein [Bacteroidia bacterium]